MFTHFRFWFVGIFLLSRFCSAQMMDIDYAQGKREENSFRVHFLRYGVIGISSLQHLNLTSEVTKFRFDAKKGLHLSFSVFGTSTLWAGNKKDLLNSFDYMMNPTGGRANGTFFVSYPIANKDTQNSKIGLSLGTKWIQGPVQPEFKSSSFFDNFVRTGWIHEQLLAEDALQNTSLSFWGFPHLQLHQLTQDSVSRFFNDELETVSYGYGLEMGLDYNETLKLIFIGQQLLNPIPESDLKRFVARLTVAYRF